MRLALKLHPESSSRAVTQIEVDVARSAGVLKLEYRVRGVIADLQLPPPVESDRRDGLWQSTCFEAFLGVHGSYHEFNFAPSTAWAAYGFSGYRMGMCDLEIEPPMITTRVDDANLAMSISLNLDGLADLWANAAWQLGLSAVVEQADGEKSYWALAHPPGKPDFHHPDCFASELAGL